MVEAEADWAGERDGFMWRGVRIFSIAWWCVAEVKRYPSSMKMDGYKQEASCTASSRDPSFLQRLSLTFLGQMRRVRGASARQVTI